MTMEVLSPPPTTALCSAVGIINRKGGKIHKTERIAFTGDLRVWSQKKSFSESLLLKS